MRERSPVSTHDNKALLVVVRVSVTDLATARCKLSCVLCQVEFRASLVVLGNYRSYTAPDLLLQATLAVVSSLHDSTIFTADTLSCILVVPRVLSLSVSFRNFWFLSTWYSNSQRLALTFFCDVLHAPIRHAS